MSETGGTRTRREPPTQPLPPFVLEALVPVALGAAVTLRVQGRSIGRVDPAVPTALGLRAGMTISPECWLLLQAAMFRRGAFDAGIRLLARRARSSAAVHKRLTSLFGEAAAQHAIGRLTPYLDDRAFARAWVTEHLGRRPLGRAALLAGLRREGVPADIAKEAVADAAPLDQEVDLARRAAAQRYARMRNVPPDRLRARLWAYLSRRGFAGYAIHAALRDVLGQSPKDDFGGGGS